MLGAAAGVLFGVSDVAIKALTGLDGDARDRDLARGCPSRSSPRSSPSTPPPAACRTARPSRSSPPPPPPPTSPPSSAASSSSATRCRATRSASLSRRFAFALVVRRRAGHAAADARGRGERAARLSSAAQVPVGAGLRLAVKRRAARAATCSGSSQSARARSPAARRGARRAAAAAPAGAWREGSAAGRARPRRSWSGTWHRRPPSGERTRAASPKRGRPRVRAASGAASSGGIRHGPAVDVGGDQRARHRAAGAGGCRGREALGDRARGARASLGVAALAAGAEADGREPRSRARTRPCGAHVSATPPPSELPATCGRSGPELGSDLRTAPRPAPRTVRAPAGERRSPACRPPPPRAERPRCARPAPNRRGEPDPVHQHATADRSRCGGGPGVTTRHAMTPAAIERVRLCSSAYASPIWITPVLTLSDLLRDLDVRLVAGEAGVDEAGPLGAHLRARRSDAVAVGRRAAADQGLQLDRPDAQREYLARLAATGSRASGSAPGSRTEVPATLSRAAEEHGFPLFDVPYEVPFIAVTEKAFTQLVNEQYAVLPRALGPRAARADRALRARARRGGRRAGVADRRPGDHLRRPRRGARPPRRGVAAARPGGRRALRGAARACGGGRPPRLRAGR